MIHAQAVGECGSEQIDLQMQEEMPLVIEANQKKIFTYHIIVPNLCDRIIINFVAEADCSDEIYQKEYEIYPVHYMI